ncbi:phage tail tape measure protein [Methylobacterium sp. WCS2018Hpa-22]|uniref:phage tail tape measure protein n=1 Tax=Methylobacterium sp. WCS2018Hpa-22 TaxID=3073633 RepID=UPI00288AA385|nr:phage tail tape measure protein [Methylobacterium sp. WCS2018Hpa-22]
MNADVAKSFSTVGKGVDNFGKRMGAAGRSTTASISAPTGLLALGAGKMAFEFEKAGNMLEALGDASGEQRKQFEAQAAKLNEKYPQTLAEIIKTGNEMLKGGFNFEQMQGAIDQTLATAVLGEMAPAEVGNMMARTINSFQMPMKTYAEAMKSSQQVSDRMTYAAVKTTASLKDMGEMYRYVGGAASAAGINFDEATAFAMAFAKNGSVGSDAGVAMRSAIVRLVKTPPKALGAMERIGMKRSDYVGGDRKVTSQNIIAGLQADGIDASSLKGAFDGLLKDKALANSPVKLAERVTKLVQSALTKSGSAVDASAIAQSVQESITAAGSSVNLTKFFTDLKAKLDRGEASLGDVATILEGRHVSRYMAVLQSDLGELLKGIQTESDGYAQSRYGVVLKGIVGPVYELGAAVEKFAVTLGRAAFPDIAKGVKAITNALDGLSKSNPTLLRFGAAVGLAAIALGPFLIFGGATVRVVGLLAKSLLLLGTASTLGLATRLVAIASGLRAIVAVTTVAAIARLRAFAAGLIVLGAVGGARGVLLALAGTVAALGRALLAAPLMLLRGAFVGVAALITPVGIAVAAIVTALTALGLWVYNNLSGLGTFFTSFGESFMKALGPEAAGSIEKVTGWLKQAWDWLNKLLGPIDESGKKWASWGEQAGAGAAAVVNSLSKLPAKIIALGTEFASATTALAKQGYDALVNFDWMAAGTSLIAKIVEGIKNAAGSLAAALSGAVSAAWERAKGAIGLGGGSAPSTGGGSSSAPAPRVDGARALGGPVKGGGTYLVGENGPELFRPGANGWIETSNTLRSLGQSGASAVAAAGSPSGAEGAKPFEIKVDASQIEAAGNTATKTGRQLHASLDTTTRPVVDTASLDAAITKANTLRSVLSAVGASTISLKTGEGEASGSGAGSSGSGDAVGSGAAASVGRASAAAVGSGASVASADVGRAAASAARRTASVGDGALRTVADQSGGRSFGARADLTAGAKESFDFWREKGLSPAAAAGFVGSEQGENNFKAHGYGDRGAAYGSMMWQGPRRRQILAGMGLNVIGATHRQQLEAAYWEMTKGPDTGARRAWTLAQNARTPGEAAAIHVDHYERPKDRGLNKRVRGGYANDWFRRLHTEAPKSAIADAGKPAVDAPKAAVAEAPKSAVAEVAKPAAVVSKVSATLPSSEASRPGDGAAVKVARALTESPSAKVKIDGARALGGSVSRGKTYLVGEKGPEIFRPGATGWIETNNTLRTLEKDGASVPAGKGSSPASKIGGVTVPTPSIKLAGARAAGGPVNRGLSYLVGEKGPEIFTPGATGQITTNRTLNRLAEVGQPAITGQAAATETANGFAAIGRPAPAGQISTDGATSRLAEVGRVPAEGEGRAIAPRPEAMAKAVGGAATSKTIHLGDKSVSVKVEANSAEGHDIGASVRREVMRIFAQLESEQRGLLSD